MRVIIEEEITYTLKEKFSRVELVERLKTFHQKILKDRNGVPFSDSVQIIRAMRDND